MKRTQITFNTGRSYTEEGQIITAIFIPERQDDYWEVQIGTLYFNDESRGIIGKFDKAQFLLGDISPLEMETVLMAMYDKGGYDNISTYDFEQLVDVEE